MFKKIIVYCATALLAVCALFNIYHFGIRALAIITIIAAIFCAIYFAMAENRKLLAIVAIMIAMFRAAVFLSSKSVFITMVSIIVIFCLIKLITHDYLIRGTVAFYVLLAAALEIIFLRSGARGMAAAVMMIAFILSCLAAANHSENEDCFFSFLEMFVVLAMYLFGTRTLVVITIIDLILCTIDCAVLQQKAFFAVISIISATILLAIFLFTGALSV